MVKQHGPLTLSKARILISNDDGIDAVGLKYLEKIAQELSKDVWVVAPETEQSAAGHSLTLRRPLRIRKVAKNKFAVDGTPTDCVLLGVNKIMNDNPPNLILSGINHGGNLGEDVTYSGTVAAAMEGALLGIPSIAFSLLVSDRARPRWITADTWVPKVLRKLVMNTWPKNVLINVNIPNVAASSVTGVEVNRQGRRKIGGELAEGRDPRGEPYFWIGAERDEDRFRKGTDLEAVHRGAISVTPLGLDFTHGVTLKKLRSVFS
jgi:5'-nucleotidase